MSDAFQVDLDALREAADGISHAVSTAKRHKVSDLDGKTSDYGHARLADSVGYFTGHWSYGIGNLTRDAGSLEAFLRHAWSAYRRTEEASAADFHGIIERAHGSDPAAQ